MAGLMELTREHLERIRDSLPVERGNVSIDVLSFLNAVLYVAENGCKWRRLPANFGSWHTIYTRMNRWSKAGCGSGCLGGCNRKDSCRSSCGWLPWTVRS